MSINSSQLMKLIRNRNNNPFVYHFFFFFSFFFSSLSSLSYVSSSARGGKERMHREVPDAIQLLAFQSILCNQPLCVCVCVSLLSMAHSMEQFFYIRQTLHVASISSTMK